MRPRSALKRSASTRLPRKKIIIFTEGKNTEPHYFACLVRSFEGALIELEIIEAAGVPKTIADKAVERLRTLRRAHRKSSFEDRDVVWAVFDRDSHPLFTEAVAQCQKNGVGTAISDPCFELWLLLHLREYDAPDDRHKLQKLLAAERPEYDPNAGKKVRCSDLVHAVVEAEARAERQLARRMEEGGKFVRPYTTVYELTRQIRAVST